MGGSRVLLALLLCLSAGSFLVRGEDPYFFYTWNVTYGTISPLGVPQQGILINGEFPGPRINCSSNNNIVINVFNNLDEPLLFTWYVSIFSSPFLMYLLCCDSAFFMCWSDMVGMVSNKGRTLGRTDCLEPIAQFSLGLISLTAFK